MTKDSKPLLRFAAFGLNHSHIYGQTKAMLDAGAELVAVYAEEDDLAHQYVTTFPQAKRVADKRVLLEDASIKLVVSAITPDVRAATAIAVWLQRALIVYEIAAPGAVRSASTRDLRAMIVPLLSSSIIACFVFFICTGFVSIGTQSFAPAM